MLIARPLCVEMRRCSVAFLAPLYSASGRSAAVLYLSQSIRGAFRDPVTDASAPCRSAHQGFARHSHSPCLRDLRARAPHAARQKSVQVRDRAQPVAAAPWDRWWPQGSEDMCSMSTDAASRASRRTVLTYWWCIMVKSQARISVPGCHR